jgi:hypothetical protein
MWQWAGLGQQKIMYGGQNQNASYWRENVMNDLSEIMDIFYTSVKVLVIKVYTHMSKLTYCEFKIWECVNSCLVPDFSRSGVGFSHLVWYCYRFVMYSLYSGEVCIFYSQSLQSFSMKECWILSRRFCIYCDDGVVFVLDSAYVLCYIYCFVYVIPSLYPWNEAYLIMVYDVLMCY